MSDRKMNDEVFSKVCDELQESTDGLKTICKKYDTSSSAFFDLIDHDPEKRQERADQYTRARERQAEYLFDLQREIVFKRDEDHTPFTGANVVNRDRLIMDTLKWQAMKLKPSKYGDKLEVEQTIKREIPLFPDVSEDNSSKPNT